MGEAGSKVLGLEFGKQREVRWEERDRVKGRMS
jgi:hypothetical protein